MAVALVTACRAAGPAPDPRAAGELRVAIREWPLPSPGSRPHDPAVGPDGALWYTAQNANRLGRLDLRTGRFREFPLKTPDSGPHGLVAGPDGGIWYTGNGAALVGRLDPVSGEVTEYRMPDRRAGDPHTPVFDARGALWFTVQRGNRVSRAPIPSGGGVVRHLVAAPDGRIFIACSGVGRVGVVELLR